MSEESLVVILDAKTNALDAALKKTDAKLDKLDKQTKKNDKSFAKLTKVAKATGKGIATISTAALAAATALSAVILTSAKTTREMKNMAATAGTSVENFKSLSFAMAQYGLDAKGTADAMNDVSERVAEFAIAGSGAMQDFFDAMGTGKDEARLFANEIKDMTGEDITQKLVNDMQDAGIAASEMNFVLKSLTNDLSYSAAAFLDNGAALKKLKSDYESATKALKLTKEESKGLQDAATSFDLFKKTAGDAVLLIGSQLAPQLTKFFGSIIKVVPDATQTLVDFFNSFKNAEDITNETSAMNLMGKEVEKLSLLKERLAETEAKAIRQGADRS